MSTNGSPDFKIFSRRKPRGTDEFLSYFRRTGTDSLPSFPSSREDCSSESSIDLVNDIGENRTEIESSDNEMDYVIFPDNGNETERLPNKEIEGRRPLHNTETNEVMGEEESDSGKTPTNKTMRSISLRDKSAPYHSPKGKQSSLTENGGETVEFLSEIQARKSLPSTPTRLSQINMDGNTSTKYSPSKRITGYQVKPSKIEKITTMKSIQHGTTPKTPATKLQITLSLKNDSANPNANSTNDSQDVGHAGEASIAVSDNPHKKESYRSCKQPLKGDSGFDAVELTDDIDEDDDDDVVVVQNDQNDEQQIDIPALKRSVISVVSHFAEENDVKSLTLEYVLNRLKALYHKDFSHRTRDIKCFIRRALERCKSLQMHKEVRPGVRKCDIDTLSSENWLNDIIIDQYMALLVKDKPKFAAISSFWYEELSREKIPNLPNDWKRLKSILAPTCVDAHWSLLRYCPRSNSVEIYTSLPVTSAEIACGKALLWLFNDKLSGRRRGQCYAPSDLPRQENEHDCGVYICMFARCVVCGNSFNIMPQQVCEFREWLKNEIVMEQLLG